MPHLATLCITLLCCSQPPAKEVANQTTKETPLPAASRRASGPLIENGMRIPRPVSTTLRKAYRFTDPRPEDLILTDIDAIPGRMQESDDQSKWRALHMHNDDVKRDRIDLISELEESGYTGVRLPELLRQKLADIAEVWDRGRGPVAAYDRLRHEIAARHKNEPIAAEAEAASLLEMIELYTVNNLRIHPGDYQKLADVELKRKDSEQAGLLLLEALHIDKDPELRRFWHEWMFQNLGPKSVGKSFVIRDRSFGHPIRLEGESLDGAKIDTTTWAGDVILVDFWGTWCVPCKEAMPELKRLHDKYKDHGLRVMGILCDYKLDKAAAWLREQDFTWPQLIDRDITKERYDKHRIAVQYAVGGFPTLWIIDRKGVLREEADRENLEEQVKTYLSEPKPQTK